jgi:abhydrolase domain-containing protein 6
MRTRRSRRADRRRRLAMRIGVGLLALIALFLLWGWRAPESVLEASLTLDAWRSRAVVQAVQVGDHRLSYLDMPGPENTPTIVMLHGFTGRKENWLVLMRAMRGQARFIALDLPGWGNSERKLATHYGFPEQAQRVAAFMDALQLQDVVLMGHSMGGGIAALTAAERPDRVQRLVLVDAAGVKFRDNDFSRAVLAGEMPFAVASTDDLPRYFRVLMKNPPTLPWPLSEGLVQRRVRDAGFERDVLNDIAFSANADLPGREAIRIGQPTLLLWCSEDQVIDIDAAAQYAQRIPQAQRWDIANCNHMPMYEQTEQTAAGLGRFLFVSPGS